MTKYYGKGKLKRTQSIRPYGPYLKPKPAVVAFGPERSIRMKSSGSRYRSYSKFFPDIFPEKKYCKLVYAQQGLMTAAGAGAGANNVFRCNSLFDPDFSGTGHQPKHHDILAAVYERYCVESARITATFWAPGSASAGQCGVYVTVRPTSGDAVSTTLDDWETLTENGSIKIEPLGSRDGGHDITTIVSRYSAKSMFGSAAINEDDNQALFGGNPSKSPTWTIGVVPINSSDTVGPIRYTVRIEYDVVAFRKKHDLGQD